MTDWQKNIITIVVVGYFILIVLTLIIVIADCIRSGKDYWK